MVTRRIWDRRVSTRQLVFEIEMASRRPLKVQPRAALLFEINTIFAVACNMQFLLRCCHATRELYIYPSEFLGKFTCTYEASVVELNEDVEKHV